MNQTAAAECLFKARQMSYIKELEMTFIFIILFVLFFLSFCSYYYPESDLTMVILHIRSVQIQINQLAMIDSQSDTKPNLACLSYCTEHVNLNLVCVHPPQKNGLLL